MLQNDITEKLEKHYTQRFIEKGATPQGVFHNGPESQLLRFIQLLKILGSETSFSLLDYGCGYGALLELLKTLPVDVAYTGYDVSDAMIQEARQRYSMFKDAVFTSKEEDLGLYDYAVESGVFNICLDTPRDEWQGYVLHAMDKMARVTKKGFALNMMTSYKDPGYMHPGHYYVDPRFMLDYCITHFSRRVALLHDYELYEFTLLVRKDENESWIT